MFAAHNFHPADVKPAKETVNQDSPAFGPCRTGSARVFGF
jgi:hypothetical protein